MLKSARVIQDHIINRRGELQKKLRDQCNRLKNIRVCKPRCCKGISSCGSSSCIFDQVAGYDGDIEERPLPLPSTHVPIPRSPPLLLPLSPAPILVPETPPISEDENNCDSADDKSCVTESTDNEPDQNCGEDTLKIAEIEDVHFGEYLARIAKLTESEDDPKAYSHVQELLSHIPKSEFTIHRVGNRDDVTLTSKGVRMVCGLLNTPKSRAFWRTTAELTRLVQEHQTLNGSDLVLESDLTRMMVAASGTYLNPNKSNEEEEYDNQFDVVDEAWVLISKGFSKQEEYEEEKRFIESLKPCVSPLSRRRLPTEVFDTLKKRCQELKRKREERSAPPTPPVEEVIDAGKKTSTIGGGGGGTRKKKNNRQDRRRRQKGKKNKTALTTTAPLV